MRTKVLGAVALGLLVAGCGTDPRERATGGAAAGAATGAAVGALGGPVGALAGAAIGGGAGAVTGAVTEPEDVNLGRPLWRDPEVRVPGGDNGGRAGGGVAASGQTRQLQQALARAGYDPGPADGVFGPRTRQAVMDWQRSNNMQATGRPDARMLSSLGVSGGAATAQGRTGNDRDRAYMGGGAVDDRDRRTGAGSTGMGGAGAGGPGNQGNAATGNMGGGAITPPARDAVPNAPTSTETGGFPGQVQRNTTGR